MSDKKNETFIDLCLDGRAVLEQVDDFVDQWHLGHDDVTLHDFLGLSQDEYSLWINDPDVLPYVIYSRKQHKPFVQVVNDDYYDNGRLAARPDQGQKIRVLQEWLQRQGYPSRAT
jgi:hypothetical protein